MSGCRDSYQLKLPRPGLYSGQCSMVVFLMSQFLIIGPCALEGIEQVRPIVEVAEKHGLVYFRANLFKPRTNTNSFQGLGRKGLPIIEFLLNHKMKLVCEAASLEQLQSVQQYASVIQIGARNMQNFELLKAVGKMTNPKQLVMLKRGFANNIHEWLSSAEYLEKSGVPRQHIILCERGSRNFPAPNGVTLDLALAWKVKQETDYKVIIDPSHGTRESSLVLPMARAAMALDFDGLMVETHPRPLESLSDPQQAIAPKALDEFLSRQLNYRPSSPPWLTKDREAGTYVQNENTYEG